MIIDYYQILTYRQVSKLRKSFANNSSADMKLSKSQLSKILQSGRFLGRLLWPLIKTSFLLKYVVKELVCVLCYYDKKQWCQQQM